MAENFAAFDYKTQEEVFTVIKHLTSILSTAGMQLIEVLSPSNLLSQLRGPEAMAAVSDVGTNTVCLDTPDHRITIDTLEGWRESYC